MLNKRSNMVTFRILRIVCIVFVWKDAWCSETDFDLNLTILRFLVKSILYSAFVVNWVLFSQTWFRNANQWYSITSWLGGFNLKAPGARSRSQRLGSGGTSPLPPRTRSFRGAEPIRNIELITENKIIQSEISYGITFILVIRHDLKIHTLPPWG